MNTKVNTNHTPKRSLNNHVFGYILSVRMG
nr:MAG TPA: hypothetical protein [Caudoviricetes sp.]